MRTSHMLPEDGFNSGHKPRLITLRFTFENSSLTCRRLLLEERQQLQKKRDVVCYNGGNGSTKLLAFVFLAATSVGRISGKLATSAGLEHPGGRGSGVPFVIARNFLAMAHI